MANLRLRVVKFSHFTSKSYLCSQCSHLWLKNSKQIKTNWCIGFSWPNEGAGEGKLCKKGSSQVYCIKILSGTLLISKSPCSSDIKQATVLFCTHHLKPTEASIYNSFCSIDDSKWKTETVIKCNILLDCCSPHWCALTWSLTKKGSTQVFITPVSLSPWSTFSVVGPRMVWQRIGAN